MIQNTQTKDNLQTIHETNGRGFCDNFTEYCLSKKKTGNHCVE